MDTVLDLRSTPLRNRHRLVCSAFSLLRSDETLQLIYDYEPRPLRRRLESLFSHQVLWIQRRLGSERWEVRLQRLPPQGNLGSLTRFMARCPIFAAASEGSRRALAAVAQVRTFRRKSIIADQEAEWPFVGAVRKGRVFAIMGTATGRDQILFEVAETEVFGNLVLFDGGPTIARFATLADGAELVLFPKNAVLRIAENDPRFTFALASSAVQQVRAIAELVHAHVAKTTLARIAASLMRSAPIESGLASVDIANVPSLRLTQIAAATGTVKEVAARAVAELERSGAIRRVRGRIAYIDRSKLATFT